MKMCLDDKISPFVKTEATQEDYIGEDGLLYCGKRQTPKEAYFAERKVFFGRDRHPTECKCKRAERKKQEAIAMEQKHFETMRRLKANGFPSQIM